MIISELNTLETVEAVSVVGGKWSGGHRGGYGGGYGHMHVPPYAAPAPAPKNTTTLVLNFTSQGNSAVTGEGSARGQYAYGWGKQPEAKEVYQYNSSTNYTEIRS